ncbi:unnamed protein product [Rotaria sp. Silwood1]|nr:unnamed protein product [Rotaria sp. Silwood1]
MGLNSTKSSLTNAEYDVTLSSPNDFYRSLSIIQGEFHLNVRKKLRIEKEIRVDLIGQLIENKKYASRSKKNSSQLNNNDNIFLTYSCQLITSHENGTARTIKQQQITYPFRIPLGSNLPPSCEFKEFSIIYYLEIYHDGRLLPNTHKQITLAPPAPQMSVPLPCYNDITMICGLQKSFYSGRDCPIVPISVAITNPRQKQIKAVTAQLMQTVSLNGIKRENEIFTAVLNEIDENTKENEVNAKCELVLPANLFPTYVPNQNGQPDNIPSVAITYEFRMTAQMKGATTPNIRLSVPIGIE